MEAAEEALKVTQAALNGQLKIVDELKDDIHTRIRADNEPDFYTDGSRSTATK